LTFESLTDHEVAVEMFPQNRFAATHHILLATWPDLIVVAPATADVIAQVANGLCPSLLSTVLCATKKKILWAPSMNEGMYTNPAVQKNIEILRAIGHVIAEVGVGEMACKSYGPGRMAEPEEIFDLIVGQLRGHGPLNGKKVVVTAGPCREALDPVRLFPIGRPGRWGLPWRSRRKSGAETLLITGPTALSDPPGIEVVRVETTAQMAAAVEGGFAGADYLVMAAAPADFRPAETSPHKIKKNDKGLTVHLTPAIDILKKISAIRADSQVVVGFSLETEMKSKMRKRSCRRSGLTISW